MYHSGCSVTICLVNMICYKTLDGRINSSNEMYSLGDIWLMMLCTKKRGRPDEQLWGKKHGSDFGCAKPKAWGGGP